MRVLHCITGLGLGGAETWLVRLLGQLPAERFHCRVVSLLELEGQAGELAGAVRERGVEVQSLGLRRGAASPGALVRLMALLRAWRPQVVQTWMYHADLLGLLAARLSGCGAAVSWGLRCAYMDFARYGLGTRLTVRACAALSGWPEAVTANSRAGAERHLALGYRPRRLSVLENGVDGGLFRPDAQARARLRAELGLGPAEALVGLVARVDAMKGHGVFCRAARRVLQERPGTRFLFCGQGTEPSAPELDALVREHGLADSAVRLGRRTDMPAVYAALDVLALASLGEGFPNVLLEGLACGVPVASLDVGDARRVAEGGGVLAAAGESGPGAAPAVQAEALARCLLAVLGQGPAERAALGARGRRHVLEHWGVAAAAARWAAHFETLASGRS